MSMLICLRQQKVLEMVSFRCLVATWLLATTSPAFAWRLSYTVYFRRFSEAGTGCPDHQQLGPRVMIQPGNCYTWNDNLKFKNFIQTRRYWYEGGDKPEQFGLCAIKLYSEKNCRGQETSRLYYANQEMLQGQCAYTQHSAASVAVSCTPYDKSKPLEQQSGWARYQLGTKGDVDGPDAVQIPQVGEI
nr:hypothetical protein CFP56_30968 [Quercus suber]